MSIRISRDLPPSGTPTRFQVWRGAALAQVDTLVADVPFPGANNAAYDAANKKLFWVDPAGDATLFYRVVVFDQDNVVLDDSGPYAFSPNTAALTPTLIRVDHNYGNVDELRYVAGSGAGVPGATVRIWKKPDYLQGLLDAAVAVTQTDDDGRWLAPVYLTPGFDYVVELAKPGQFGPDTVTITV